MRKAVIGATVTAALMVAAAVALAVPASQTLTYGGSFAAKTSTTNSAFRFSTSSSDPGNSQNNNQPVATTEVDVALAPGSVFDTSAVPVCRATDNRVTQSGGTVCPKNTKVATGTGTVELPGGFQSAPISLQLTAWNARKHLIIYVKPSIGQPFVLRPLIKGNPRNRPTLVTKTPPNCLPPSVPQNGHCVNPNGGKAQEAILTSFALTIVKKGTAKHPYIRTPKKCVKAKGWVSKGTFKYEDGTRRSLTSKQACK